MLKRSDCIHWEACHRKNHFWCTYCIYFEKAREADKPDAKDTKGKLDLTTVPPSLIEAVAKVREYGIAKYKERDNWKKVEAAEYEKALYRHWLAYLKGEEVDTESGLHHLAHMACNIAFLIELKG